VDPVGRLSLVASRFANIVAETGGTSQHVAFQALVCSSAVVGTMYISVVFSLIHFSRSLVWGCGRDQSFDARGGCIRLQLRWEHLCPLMRKAMQYLDRGPVWFGTLGIGAKPPSVECLLIILPRSWGTVLPGRLGAVEVDRCMQELTHLRFCPVPITRLCVPDKVRSVMPGDR
jgi:hypothetical protein